MAQRCIRCLQMSEEQVCPACGWPEKGQNASHQLPVGTVLRGRYLIGRALGQGGFGITYLAWDELMQQSVAVKEFYPNGTVFRKSAVSLAVECGTEEIIPHYEYSKERFLREASALVQFKDIPEVVDILDFSEENNTAYIVMEYVRGVDLAKYIQMKGGRLGVEETFRILKPVMEALAKVHKGGIVHRDISPDNIILDPMGGAKLLDFGAVRAVEDPDVDKGLNKSTEAILKQGFAPIEQYNSRGSLGPWTDEYAMCATIWYCLTGKVPEEASIRLGEGIDPDWSTIPGLPEHQQRALEKGFRCRAKDRYKSIDELLADLFPEAVEEIPISIPEPAKVAPVRAVKEKAKPRKKGWLWAIPAVLAVLIAAAVFLPKRMDTQPEETAPAQIQTQPATEATEPSTVPLSPEEETYALAEALLAEGKLGEAAITFGRLAGYSDARERSFEIWDKIAVRDVISAGTDLTLGLKNDGTVISTAAYAPEWTEIMAVAVESGHAAGLRTDGTVIDVGSYTFLIWNDPHREYRAEEWTDIVAVSTGIKHSVGLKADGTVVAVGLTQDGQCNVTDWTGIVAVAAGQVHTVGLKADGTVIAVGGNYTGRNYKGGPCDVEGWTNIVAIAAGASYTLGLKDDGTVVAAGYNEFGQCDVEDWTDIVAISAGSQHAIGLKSDGTVVMAGNDYMNDRNHAEYYKSRPSDVKNWTDIVAIAAGDCHCVGLKSDGTVVAVGRNIRGECEVNGWTDILQPKERIPFR